MPPDNTPLRRVSAIGVVISAQYLRSESPLSAVTAGPSRSARCGHSPSGQDVAARPAEPAIRYGRKIESWVNSKSADKADARVQKGIDRETLGVNK